jgi:excisionase family DNA binding protein
MSEMLTAKELQDLLQVDRSTIYRMAESGRLPAIKVGRQWRFPSEQVERWFQLQSPDTLNIDTEASISESIRDDELGQLLPLECVQQIQDVFADLLGVMLVITDIEGNPITKPSHSCGLFNVIQEQPQALQRCIQSWQDLANAIDLEPKFSLSHLGLLCTRAMIRVGPELKGMVVAGCVAPSDWPPLPDAVDELAQEFGVPSSQFNDHLDEVFYLLDEQRQLVLANLQRIANVVAHIVNERKSLIWRLEAIADLTTI